MSTGILKLEHHEQVYECQILQLILFFMVLGYNAYKFDTYHIDVEYALRCFGNTNQLRYKMILASHVQWPSRWDKLGGQIKCVSS